MYSENELADIRSRANFYNKKEVAKFLLAEGVPRTRQAMLKLVELANPRSNSIQESFDCLTNVAFIIHPQQINIRDKTNGQIIVSIPR
jgi:hypothetical protein